MSQLAIKRYIGASVLLVGAMVFAFGIVFIVQGWNARQEVKAALAEEQVYVTIDGERLLVDDPELAMYQADVIKGHTLGTYGPWQSLERTDPNRASMLDGLTLRNSLTMARMALDLSNLVMGLGVIFTVTGTALGVAGVVLVGIARFVTAPARERRLVPATVPVRG